MKIKDVNKLEQYKFNYIFKNIFEHSDFITKIVENNRPFKNKEEVIDNFLKTFDSLMKILKLI